MSKSSQYVGLDVSLKETSICVIDDAGKIMWRGRTDTTPEAIASAVKQHAPHAVRIGLESGQLSTWLFHELLHENGSLYVHLDWHVSHAAKCVLDEVFGVERCQNEIASSTSEVDSEVRAGAGSPI